MVNRNEKLNGNNHLFHNHIYFLLIRKIIPGHFSIRTMVIHKKMSIQIKESKSNTDVSNIKLTSNIFDRLSSLEKRLSL